MDFLAIGQQFVQHYYNVFDTNRPVSVAMMVTVVVATEGALH
jgi:hypothetical protein